MTIADRLLGWTRARLGFAPTQWSLVRIAVFAAVGLVVASLLVPARPGTLNDAAYNRTLATSTTRNVARPFGDTRGFRPTSRPRSFQVAWIGGSETLAVGKKTRGFIPGLVGDRIGSVDGKRVSTDVYYMNAIRLVDELSALSAAVASKPDLVVVSLNPVWVLNDLAVQQWGYLDGILARHSVWPPQNWPVAASLVSPGDVAWKGLSSLSSAVADRYDWGVELTDRTDGLTFLDNVKDAPPPTLSGLAQLGQRRPVDFFFQHFDAKPEANSLSGTQLAILQRELASRSTFNQTVLRQMLRIVRNAGVDAYFYLAPISPAVYDDPAAHKYLDEVRALLASATDGRTSSRVVFDPKGLQDRVPRTEFEDIVHVLDGSLEARVLSGDICALLAKQAERTGCEG